MMNGIEIQHSSFSIHHFRYAPNPAKAPWYFLGYTQHAVLPLIQVADLAGVAAVTVLVAAVNGLLAEAVGWVAAITSDPTGAMPDAARRYCAGARGASCSARTPAAVRSTRSPFAAWPPRSSIAA